MAECINEGIFCGECVAAQNQGSYATVDVTGYWEERDQNNNYVPQQVTLTFIARDQRLFQKSWMEKAAENKWPVKCKFKLSVGNNGMFAELTHKPRVLFLTPNKSENAQPAAAGAPAGGGYGGNAEPPF